MANSTCVIILAGHRTGSSALAGLVKRLGVFMGHKFVGKTEFNQRGHYEDVAFLRLHKRIVGNWKRPCVDFEPFREPYTKLVRERERNFPLWGFKDPRFCYVFPYFQQIAQSKLVVISLFRNIGATEKSLMARKGKPRINVSEPQAAKIARCYRDAQWLARNTYSGPVLPVLYGRLVECPMDEAARIAKFIGVPVTESAIEFIDSRLKHF